MHALLPCAALLTCLARADGPAAETVTWEICVKEALANNPDLIQARADAAAAVARRNAAFGGFLPRAGASLSGSDSDKDDRLWFKNLNSSWSARATVSQSLFSGFSTVADAARASASARRAGALARQAEADIRQRLRRAFVDVLFGQANVVVQASIAKRRQGNADLVQLKYEGGREDKGSAMRSAAVARQAQFEEARSRRALTLARRRLAQEMGRDAAAPFTVAAEWTIIAPPAAPDLDKLSTDIPSVRQAEASADEARAGLWSAGSPFWPDVDANASIGRDGPALPPDRARSWSAGVSASWNLFNGGRDVFSFSAARSANTSAQAGLTDARRTARTSVEAALVGWLDAHEQLEVARQFLAAEQVRAEVGRAEYGNCRIGFQEWDQIEDAMVSAERGEVSARRDTLNAEAEWRRSSGRGFAALRPGEAGAE